VVGRLARRHGLAVALRHTPGSGVTVVVSLSGAPLPGQHVAAVEPVVSAPEPQPSIAEPSPRPIGPRVTATDVISRVTVAMRDPLTFNGFEPVRRLAAPPAPEVASLHRRVPGAQLPVEAAPPVNRPAADLDPDQARNLVEQFESGVARALQPHDAAGAERQ
jgi:hypothetical protein